ELPRGQEYDVYIDARTGAVKQTAVSYEEAGKIALDAVFNRVQQQGRLDDVELKMKNGKSYYEVEVKVPSGMEFEVYIDAQTGNVTNIKID
ncbi:MAG: PepSY domain-containing protein, partial [Neisseriaceae bacterium]|nr:PepSY domain-containing protein [Neisseriaceae bacterium]